VILASPSRLAISPGRVLLDKVRELSPRCPFSVWLGVTGLICHTTHSMYRVDPISRGIPWRLSQSPTLPQRRSLYGITGTVHCVLCVLVLYLGHPRLVLVTAQPCRVEPIAWKK
jgi:hypothetical protein